MNIPPEAVEAARQAWRDNSSRNGAYCPTETCTAAMIEAAMPFVLAALERQPNIEGVRPI